MYPAASLTGAGKINDHPVRCISPEWIVKFHSGYELKDKDLKDISAICKKFGIEPPDEYKRRRSR
jgi:lincosamide nucleotidyltransferase A/C/D/E